MPAFLPALLTAKMLAYMGIIGGAYVGLSKLANQVALHRAWDENAQALQVKHTYSVILPAYKEPHDTLMKTIQSIRNQNVVRVNPNNFEFIYVGTQGDPLFDKGLVAPHFHKVLEASRGKLNARDLGTREASGKYIISVDADTDYPVNAFNMLIEPFEKEEYPPVGTTGGWDMGRYRELWALVPKYLYLSNLMLGRLSAYERDAYFAVGGFDLSVNQTKILEIWPEEEPGFKRKLDQIGTVKYVDVPVKEFYDDAPTFRGIRSTYTLLRGKKALEYDSGHFVF